MDFGLGLLIFVFVLVAGYWMSKLTENQLVGAALTGLAVTAYVVFFVV